MTTIKNRELFSLRSQNNSDNQNNNPDLIAIFLFFLMVVISNSSYGSQILWHGDVDSDWNNPYNWEGNAFPSTNEMALIDPTAFAYENAPVMSSNSLFTVSELKITNSGSFAVEDGEIKINNDLELSFNSTVTLNGGYVEIENTLKISNNSLFDQNAGVLSAFEVSIGDATDTPASGYNIINVLDAQFQVNSKLEIHGNDNILNFGASSEIEIISSIDFHSSEENSVNIYGSATFDTDYTKFNEASSSNRFNISDDALATLTNGDCCLADAEVIINFALDGDAELYFGSLSLPTALPVELLYFTSTFQHSTVQLTWATAAEINNHYFEVQRWVEGGEYVTIGLINGHGDSQDKIEYHFNDNRPLLGLSYYRLIQVDFDGTQDIVATSSVISAEIDLNTSMDVWPNPSKDRRFTIAIPTAEYSTSNQLSIFDTAGVLVWEQTNLFDDLVSVDLNQVNVRPGIYVVRYNDQFVSSNSKVRIL